MVNGDRQLDKLYAARFTAKQLKAKEKLWKILCSQFLQRYVPHESTVVDLGAGFCEFINNIECKTKFAVDVAPHAVRYANSGVVVKSTLSELPSSSVDVVFCSNFFEHLPSKEKMVQILLEIWRVLRPLGTVMIIQPNIYYAYREYWDHFDHRLPLSHRAMDEILRAIGFQILQLIPNFLPYSTRTPLMQLPFLLRMYLSLPFLRVLFGKQMFILAQKT